MIVLPDGVLERAVCNKKRGHGKRRHRDYIEGGNGKGRWKLEVTWK
jgi:hypothetical protein